MVNIINRLIKLLYTTTLFFMGLVIIFIMNSEDVGYVLSIYDTMPQCLWFIYFIFIALNVTAIVNGIFLLENSRYIKIGTFILLFMSVFVLLLPYLNGVEYVNRGDLLTHIGKSKLLLSEHKLEKQNVYPLVHVFLSEIAFVLKVKISQIAHFVGPFFYVLFVAFNFILAKKLLCNRIDFLVMLLSTILFCYYYKEIFPMGYSLMLFPLIVYLHFQYQTKYDIGYIIGLLIFVVLLPMFHPVVAFLVFIYFLISEITRYIYIKIHNLPKKNKFLLYPIVLIIILFTWLWQASWAWRQMILSFYNIFVNDTMNVSMINKASGAFDKLDYNVTEIAVLFVKMYGHVFLFILLSLMVIVLLIMGKLYKYIKTEYYHLFLGYIFFYFLIFIIQVIDYLRPVSNLSSGRFIYLIIVMFLILVGISIYKIYEKLLIKNKKIALLAMVTIVFVPFCVGALNLYPSPFVDKRGHNLAMQELKGVDWIYMYKKSKCYILSFSPKLYTDRYYDLNNFNDPSRAIELDEHFGYKKHVKKLGYIYPNNTFFILTKMDRFYTKIWPQVDRFTNEDFNRIENDNTIFKIYDNGQFNCYYM